MLASVDSIKATMYRKLVQLYLSKKLNIVSEDKVDWKLREVIVDKIPSHLKIWLSKSFTNFARTLHQLFR